MRFLVDACAGRRLAKWLHSQGHGALFSDDLGTDPGDQALLQYAAAENRVLVTIDMDFGELKKCVRLLLSVASTSEFRIGYRHK